MSAYKLMKCLAAAVILLAGTLPRTLQAQDADQAPLFKKEELAQLLAPIALYPDDLLSNVLMASTYPLEVVQAARWRKDPENAKLEGEDLTKALDAKDWDPSVKALTLVPDVLQMMSEKLEWTQKLGDAFLAQEDDVMNQIQALRMKAEDAGSLKSNEQQKVSRKQDDGSSEIIIQQTSPDVVYVPIYEPAVVYGSWWYPDYPPYYWYGGYPTSAFVSGFFWGTGYAVARSLWGWGYCDWRHRNIHIDVDRYNRINVNNPKITSNTWVHNPRHRGPVPYRDHASREKFGKNGDRFKEAGKDFRGFHDRDSVEGVRDKLAAGAAGAGAAKLHDKISKGDAAKVKDRVGNIDKGKLKDKAGAHKDRPNKGKMKDKVSDKTAKKKPSHKRPSGSPHKRPSSKTRHKPSARRSSSGPRRSNAFDMKRGRDVAKHASRGRASRSGMSRHGGGMRRGGGGHGRRR
ncbi:MULTISPECIES: DUF3300 domain-containing protein [Filomicrobium]|uniref:DUF3300 domain-containing protein n=1 Tax=Filomicrobium insigne TaxID=418854 RepID=A0A1H0N8M8_9HYPH|nr:MULTISPECIES: DUF3300 domain-containing protein [Filomicrobium]SDO89008.1 Protein of unknown function [Filomicrobium insigne]